MYRYEMYGYASIYKIKHLCLHREAVFVTLYCTHTKYIIDCVVLDKYMGIIHS